MLSLRLARGAHPLVLLRRLLVTAASAGTGFLLLCSLGYAAAHPGESGGSQQRLLWCAVPLAATVQLAVAIARIDRGTEGGPGLTAAGFGPARSARLAAASTTLFCGLGSALALAAFVCARRYQAELPTAALTGYLGRGTHLPLGAVLLLPAAVPAVAGVTSTIFLWPRQERSRRPEPPAAAVAVPAERSAPDQPTEGRAERAEGDGPADSAPAARSGSAPAPTAGPVDTGLPWGVALIAAGLALESYACRGAGAAAGELLPLPDRTVQSPPGVFVGWVLAVIGLMLAGTGLAQLCGRVLAAGRPGPLRLLAGRALEVDAKRLGRPLGVLCAVATSAYAIVDLYGRALRSAGAVAGLGAALVMACATATALTAAMEVRGIREGTTSTLIRIGASTRLLRAAVALRGTVLLTVLAGLTCAVAELLTVPLPG